MFRRIGQISLSALTALILVACDREPAAPSVANQATSETSAKIAPAPLVKAEGVPAGSVTVKHDPNGVSLTIAAAGLPPGAHGVHLHAVGKCQGPKFESAGAHWNPARREHGRDNPQGAHLGDLANLEIAADGSGESIFAIGSASLTEGANAIVDSDGTALVIHAKRDDYRTDPSGDSGDRIACAVISAAN